MNLEQIAAPSWAEFNEWMHKELPAGTIIGNPGWWASRIYKRFFAAPPVCPTCTQMIDEAAKAERFFSFEFEVWQGDEMVASASGPRDDAIREAMHYAAQYEQDGPVRVFEVQRTLVEPSAAAPEYKKP